MTELKAKQPTHMERIKAGIWDIHEGVTSGEKKKPSDEDNIMKGTLPKFKYVNSLKQRYLLQKGFEAVLAKHRDNALVGAVVTDEQFHTEKSSIDLQFFGIDPLTVEAIPTTSAMIAYFHEIAQRDPRLLLAIHYTIEGSNNGAIHIAQAVKRAYDLKGTDGTLHLQPYGTEIRTKWKAFGEAFNGCDIDDALMDEMIEVGRQTFHHMNDVMVEAYALPEEAV